MWLFILFVLAPSVLCTNKTCPGGRTSCPDSSTCCPFADKSYGCCPLVDAVCCNDHGIYCCPSDRQCYAGKCYKLHGMNVTATRLNEDIICDSKFSCPNNSTCCKGSSPDTYECCPIPNAVCCSDFSHYCPENTVCDLEYLMCLGKGFATQMYDTKKNGISRFSSSKYLTSLKPVQLNNVFCSGSYQCPNGQTCCQLPSGKWGCCPFPKATCCPDKLHCCPHGMKCDSTSHSCSRGHLSIPSLQKEIAKPFKTGIVCPDNSTCADSMICCKTGLEHFGCCPYEDAVCCKDLTHCCPRDYACDIVEKKCVAKSMLSII